MLSPYDSVIRSLLVAVYELGCEEMMVVHHSDCGLCHLEAQHFIDLMKLRGISDEALAEAAEHVDLENYLSGFEDTEEDVRRTVAAIQRHPLMPRQIVVRGFMIDSYTGELREVE